MTKFISKFIRICREGATIDGRTITRQQIDEMAANYDPKIYGARIWLEHLRSLLPDGIFKALGDVIALKAEDDESGKRVLLAQLSPTAELLEINKNKQKVFTSIEIDPQFSDTNQAYLVGLAVTDSPASLGTEMLCFSQKHRHEFKNQFNLSDHIFSEAIEVSHFDFNVEQTEEKSKLLSRIKEVLSNQPKNQKLALQDIESSIITIAQSQHALQSQFNDHCSQQDFNTLRFEIETLKMQVTELYNQLSQQTDHPQRPAATGINDTALTDC